jgi:hypothetical protein
MFSGRSGAAGRAERLGQCRISDTRLFNALEHPPPPTDLNAAAKLAEQQVGVFNEIGREARAA